MTGPIQPPPTRYELRTLTDRIRNVPLDFGDSRRVDEWTLMSLPVQAIPDNQIGYTSPQLREEFLVYARVHENSVGADTRLTRVAELRCQRARDGKIHVCILEDEKRCVTP